MPQNPENLPEDHTTDAPPQGETTAPKTTEKPIHFTSRNPPWTYLKLQLVHQPNAPASAISTPLDPLTARTLLTSALSQFLGLTGTAIPIDILKITSPSPDSSESSPSQIQIQSQNRNQKSVWIRVPREDGPAVVAALSSWIGGNKASGGGNVAWRVCAKGNYLGALVAGDGGDLFMPG